jgi:hypothetical protein
MSNLTELMDVTFEEFQCKILDGDTHTYVGECTIYSNGKVFVEIDGEIWHSYDGASGYQGFNKKQIHTFESFEDAVLVGLILGNKIYN